VHLTDFPKSDAALIDEDLDKAIRLAMRIASLGRAARSKGKLKVRQPLARVIVRARPEEAQYLAVISDQVLEELNVKALEVATDDALATFKLRPNLPALGPKYGKQIGAIRAALATADAGAVAATLRDGGTVTVGGFTLDETEILVDVEERDGFAVSIDSSGGLMVGLDTDLTPELEAEGMAREIVHRLQNARKAAGLEIEDRITAYISGAPDAVTSALAAHDAYLRQETLSDDVRLESAPANAYSEEQDIEGVKLTLGVVKSN
jgi:isoleucyl-tRNA synthetase